MKKLLFLFVMLFCVSSITTYASFPVTNNDITHEVVIDEPNSQAPAPYSGGTNAFGIVALCCGILGLLILPILFGPLAIVFGAIGLNKKGKGMAITGFVLGIVQIIVMIALLASI